MTLSLWWSDLKEAHVKGQNFLDFAQKMANRLVIGVHRYDKGKPIVAAKYLTRAKAEFKAYERTGNQEHLVNAANYCFLECAAPELPGSHFKHETKSVTRDQLRMKL